MKDAGCTCSKDVERLTRELAEARKMREEDYAESVRLRSDLAKQLADSDRHRAALTEVMDGCDAAIAPLAKRMGKRQPLDRSDETAHLDGPAERVDIFVKRVADAAVAKLAESERQLALAVKAHADIYFALAPLAEACGVQAKCPMCICDEPGDDVCRVHPDPNKTAGQQAVPTVLGEPLPAYVQRVADAALAELGAWERAARQNLGEL